eukprot:Em0006g630a
MLHCNCHDYAEPLLQSIIGETVEGEMRDDPLMLYYVKVMKLFEQVSAPDMVINVATEAAKLGDRDCPSTVGHFYYYNYSFIPSSVNVKGLLFGQLYSSTTLSWVTSALAYEAMVNNPDPSRSVLYWVCTVPGLYCTCVCTVLGSCTVLCLYCAGSVLGSVLYCVCNCAGSVLGLYCAGSVLCRVCTVLLSVLCWVCTGSVLYWVCTVLGLYCTGSVLGLYCAGSVLCCVCTVLGLYCTGSLLYWVCTVLCLYCAGSVLGLYCAGSVLCRVCTVLCLYCAGSVLGLYCTGSCTVPGLYWVCTVLGLYCAVSVLCWVCTVLGLYCTGSCTVLCLYCAGSVLGLYCAGSVLCRVCTVLCLYCAGSVLGLYCTRRKDCVQRFVVVLTEQKAVKELCQFPYTGLEDEVERVMENRARSVDLTSTTTTTSCTVSTPREETTEKANCLVIAMAALSLTDKRYAWIVRPAKLDEHGGKDQPGSSEKHTKRRREEKRTKQPVEVLTLPDLEKEYLLVKAKLNILQREPSMSTQLCSPYVSAGEVVSLLVQAGFFDMAIQASQGFKLPLTHVLKL